MHVEFRVDNALFQIPATITARVKKEITKK
jgi:hypothetical protein